MAQRVVETKLRKYIDRCIVHVVTMISTSTTNHWFPRSDKTSLVEDSNVYLFGIPDKWHLFQCQPEIYNALLARIRNFIPIL